jgi:hypothetical protein
MNDKNRADKIFRHLNYRIYGKFFKELTVIFSSEANADNVNFNNELLREQFLFAFVDNLIKKDFALKFDEELFK